MKQRLHNSIAAGLVVLIVAWLLLMLEASKAPDGWLCHWGIGEGCPPASD